MEKLKTLSEEEKSKIINEINTELTSIAEEEKKTGKKINIPSAEKLVSIMSMDLIKCRKEISNLLPKMSKKAIYRATLAFLDLPTEGIPVLLKTEEEKKLFSFAQRAIQARYVIIKHHTDKLIQEERIKQQEKKEEENVNV